MEPTVVSSPLGHSAWESEQPFPLTFQTLDSDSADVFCQNRSGQTGLDLRTHDQDHSCPPDEDKNIFLDKLVELDNHPDVSRFSHGDVDFKGDNCNIPQTSPHSTQVEELAHTDKIKGLDEISDSTLSWLFPPNFADVMGQNSFCKENQPVTQDSSLGGLDVLSSQTGLISLNVPSSPSKTNTGDQFLLVDLLSDEHACVAPESSGDLNPECVSKELLDLPPSHLECRETLTPETGEQGLFPDQVTEELITGSSTLQGLPENCLPHDHVSTPVDCFNGSVPLLDLEFPDTDCSLSLCPVSLSSVNCSESTLDISPDELKEVHPQSAGIENLTSEQQGENDSFALDLFEVSSPLTLPLAEDALTQGDFASESRSLESISKDLMEDQIWPEANQVDKGMALDLCLTVEGVHNEQSWALKPLEEAQNEESILNPAVEQREGETLVETNKLEGPDCDEAGSFDFSAQDLNTPESRWTSEQAEESVSLSKMVVHDSLPMVSAENVREEDMSPLKAVFDALDQDGDGFVRIEEFMEFAAAYGADQVKDLTKFLDPSGLGVISFEDFHRGISAISNGGPEPQLYNVNYSPGDGAVGCPEEYDEQNEVTDSAYLGSESTYSECETFTDEDTGALVPPEMHEDVETDSGIEATLHDPEDGGNRFSLNSELHNHSLVTVIGGEEEHFEDFGESNTSELLLESNVEGPGGEDDSHLTSSPEQVNGSSLLSPSAGKRLSSKKVARHLLQNSSMTLDTMSDLTRDILELADNDITDKVLLLERRVAELEKESESSGEQHARLRQENLQLVHRANALEEQLKEQELHADEQVQQETRRHKEAMSKLERETGMELENMQARLQQLDEENSELRSCVPCLRANIERLEEEKRKLQDETEAMSDRLQDEMETRRKMGDKLSHERHQNQKEKESTQELIEDLRKQLEHLQLYKLEAEAKRGRLPGAGLQEYQTRTREAELEQEIKRLKQDNRTLKEQNDELNGQIINLSIQGAKNLMSASFSDSLAAEINSVSRTELMEAIHKQEEINYRLQDYIDKIIVAIMESNPSILEVK
ncbi:rab11 family-interacting protein 3 isoform 1-T1 [Pholidichthys leucotaenia]